MDDDDDAIVRGWDGLRPSHRARRRDGVFELGLFGPLFDEGCDNGGVSLDEVLRARLRAGLHDLDAW